jgi:site-specific DNA-adenine methylase
MTAKQNDPMPIKCVIPLAGGKRRLAKRIATELPRMVRYAEPFTGGCAVRHALGDYLVTNLNDANQAVVTVLRAVRSYQLGISTRLGKIPFTREAFDAAVNTVATVPLVGTYDIPNLDAVAAQLAVWWMGRNGHAGTKIKPGFGLRHTKTGGDPAVRWENYKRSLPALSERLQSCVIYNLDFRTFLASETVDAAGQGIYCDPPYLAKTFRYTHDFTAQDHRDLARILNGYKHARIVLSYRDEVGPEGLTLAELYPAERWRRVFVEQSKAMASASGTAKRNTEVLLVNDADRHDPLPNEGDKSDG